MKILSINAGSSSLKFKMYDMPSETVLIYGYIEKIGSVGDYKIITDDVYEFERQIDSHDDAVKILIKSLFEYNIIESLDEIKAIGHRIVNGKDHFLPELVNDDVLKRLREISFLSKVHMEGHIAGIEAFRKLIPEVPQILIYDTAFHHTIPEKNFLYAVPYEWYAKYGVRKYGFHGISAQYITKKMEEKLNRQVNLIICHIGNGASITAVKDSKSLDNSMGFTANCGLIMGTRCGDIDYSFLPYVTRKSGKSLEEIDEILNYQSGLEGFVNGASDNRDLEKHIKDGDSRAILINEMFLNRVVDYIAKYYLMLDSIDAIVFCGGIGENNIKFRERILFRLRKLGITLNKETNDSISKFSKTNSGIISGDDSLVKCYVIPTDEEVMMAIDTYNFIKGAWLYEFIYKNI